jgi:peptidoglycan/LPS O-acetylase OafA/YrhL
MGDATLFPVIPYFFADKGIRIFTPDITPGADFAPARQHFFHFHFASFLQVHQPATQMPQKPSLWTLTLEGDFYAAVVLSAFLRKSMHFGSIIVK